MRSAKTWLLLLASLLAIAAILIWKIGLPGQRPALVVETTSAPLAATPVPESTPTPTPATPAPVAVATPAKPSPVAVASPAPGIPPRMVAREAFALPVTPGGFSPTERDHLATEIRNVQNSLRSYRDLMGGNPVGNNQDITKALLGDNPRNAKLGIPAGSSLNGNGETCDRWGTPYFFHPLSAEKMEVRSAGPDRTMWTEDDLQF